MIDGICEEKVGINNFPPRTVYFKISNNIYIIKQICRTTNTIIYERE